MPILSRPATTHEIRVNGYVDPRLRAISIQQSLGGANADHAILAFDFGPALPAFGGDNGADPRQAHLVDVSLAKLNIGPGGNNYVGAVCEISQIPGGGGTPEVVHFGRISLAQAKIGRDSEALQLVSRFDRQMFGAPLLFQRVLDPATQQLTTLEEPCVFNPEIDGVSFPNRRFPKGTTTAGDSRPLFVHPESLRTIAAGLYQRALTPLEAILSGEILESPSTGWTLPTAVQYLCAECNPLQRYVQNPTDAGLAVLDTDPGTLRHHVLSPGLYLNEALDQLLTPYGYTWRIEYLAPGQRRLRCERQGSNDLPPQPIRLQRPGATLDPALSDAADIDLDCDTGQVVNQVRVLGAFTQVEATFELVPAWLKAADNTSFLNTIKSYQTSPGEFAWDSTPQYHRVHRDWVLNEAGDYNGLRPGNAAFDLTALFRQVYGDEHPTIAAKRRRFLPTLTVKRGSNVGAGGENQPIGEHGGIKVEWFNNLTSQWTPAAASDAGFSVKILTSECGIRFDGDHPPYQLIAAVQAGTARVRVTATIESDTRLSYVAPREANSLAFDVVETVLDMPHSFHLRAVNRQNPNRSNYHDSQYYVALEADGREAMARFANLLRQHWDMADVSGNVQIEGLDRGRYKLAGTVDLIDNRGIRLNAVGDGSGGIYPQIVSRTLDVQNQREILHLATFRRDVRDVLRLAQQTERITGRRIQRRTMRRGSGIR